MADKAGSSDPVNCWGLLTKGASEESGRAARELCNTLGAAESDSCAAIEKAPARAVPGVLVIACLHIDLPGPALTTC